MKALNKALPKVVPWWLALVGLVAGAVQLAAWEIDVWIRVAVMGALGLILLLAVVYQAGVRVGSAELDYLTRTAQYDAAIGQVLPSVPIVANPPGNHPLAQLPLPQRIVNIAMNPAQKAMRKNLSYDVDVLAWLPDAQKTNLDVWAAAIADGRPHGTWQLPTAKAQLAPLLEDAARECASGDLAARIDRTPGVPDLVILRDLGYKSFFAVSLVSNGRPFGVLMLAAREPSAIHGPEKLYAHRLAALIGVVESLRPRP